MNASRIPWVPYAIVQMINIYLKDKLRDFGMNRLKNNAHNNPPIGMNYPNNAPGLYITPYTNNLLVVMNTFDVTVILFK